MDPVGSAASLLAIVQTVAVVVNAALKLHRELKDAPQQLEQIAKRVQRIEARLDALRRLRYGSFSALERNGYLIVRPEELMTLHNSVEDAENCLNSIRDFPILRDKAPGKRTSLRWLSKDRSPVLQLLGHLEEIERGLAMLHDIIQTTILTVLVSATQGIDTATQGITSKLDMVLEVFRDIKISPLLETGNHLQIESSAGTNPSILRHNASQICHDVQKGSTWLPRIWKWRVAEDPWSTGSGDSSLALRTHWNEWQSTYTVTGHIRMPSILSGYAIELHAQLKLFKVSWPSIAPSLSFRSVIPSTSEFLRACRKGDKTVVKQLVLDGKGRASDIDDMGRPAFHYAIQSGSVETVQFMIDIGANVNDLHLPSHSNPLQIACLLVHYGKQSLDIARILVANGSSVDHVSADGATSLSNLYSIGRLDSGIRLEFIQFLLACSVLAYTADNEDLKCPICAAAMYGSGDEIELLVKGGASLRNTERALRDTVRYSNVSAYDYLVSRVAGPWINEMDSRGQTPLTSVFSFKPVHLAARVGMIKRLLDAGADVHLRDGDGFLPEEMAQREQRWCLKNYPPSKGWRPESAGGNMAIDAYVEALRSSLYDVSVDDEGGIFWPANDEDALTDRSNRFTVLAAEVSTQP